MLSLFTSQPSLFGTGGCFVPLSSLDRPNARTIHWEFFLKNKTMFIKSCIFLTIVLQCDRTHCSNTHTCMVRSLNIHRSPHISPILRSTPQPLPELPRNTPIMQPGYLKLGIFALRLSLHSSPDDEQDLPLISFRTSHLRRYFHEQDDSYSPYVAAKYSDYRMHKKRWEERQAEERSEVERREQEMRDQGRKCVALERRGRRRRAWR